MKTDARIRSIDNARDAGHGQQGFTLIETAIALVVMMIVGLGAASLFVYAMGRNSSARDRELSMAVAQQQIESLRNATFANLDARVTATGGGDKIVASAGREYRVITSLTAGATRRTITVKVTPRGTNTAGLTAIQETFGGVTLVTERTADSLGTYFRH